MATNYWLGTAIAVKQVTTITISGTTDGTTTARVSIGGTNGAPTIQVTSATSGGTNANVATALQTALAASTEPYFTNVTWTVSGAVVTGTAGTAGVPFIITVSLPVPGPSGAIAQSTTTASSGPNDWTTVANWSLAAVPVGTDDVVFQDSASNVAYGLSQSAVTLNSLRFKKSYTGRIGLNRVGFAISSDGSALDSTRVDYRLAYLTILCSGTVTIGEGAGVGSGRILLDMGATATTIEVLNTAPQSADAPKPGIRVKAASATTDVFVRSAPAGVGIAVDTPGETATVRKIFISDTTSASQITSSSGVTMTTWEQLGGINLLQSAAAVPTINVKGGSVQLEGTFAVTTINLYSGGSMVSNTTGVITTLNLYGGTIDFTGSSRPRTVTTVAWQLGSTAILKGDMSILTITTPTFQTTRFTLSMS